MDSDTDAAVVRLAHDCPLLSRARALSAFVGDGRPVTAKGVLRRADTGPACSAAGLPDPGRVVSAADVPALHRAWIAAQGAGLLALGLNRATAATPDAGELAQWRNGLAAVLRSESSDDRRVGASVACRAVLRVLAAAPGLDPHRFSDAVEATLETLPFVDRITAYDAFRRGHLPETGAFELLVDCGAVDPGPRRLTPLGHWALDALAEPVVRAPAWAEDEILQLRVGLDHVRPPVWRRVLLPAGTTLGQLHRIVQLLFEWDDDHLHVFTVEGLHYADPWHELEGCADENDATLAVSLPRPGASLSYRYDLGDCWDHTIVLEKTFPGEPGAGPRCIGGRGEAPPEDWSGDETPPPRPFRLDVCNEHLAHLRPAP